MLKKIWETSIKSLGEQRRVLRGISMSPMRNMVSRLTWSGTSVPSATKKKNDNMKKGMAGMILYKKRNTSSFRKILLLLIKLFSPLCFLHERATKYCVWRWFLLPRGKCRDPTITSENNKWWVLLDYCNGSCFGKENVMVRIILIRWSIRITWWWWWHTPPHLCCWLKGKYFAGL